MRRALIEEQNRYLVEHQRQFRLAADVVVEAWTAFVEVQAIAVIGSTGAAFHESGEGQAALGMTAIT